MNMSREERIHIIMSIVLYTSVFFMVIIGAVVKNKTDSEIKRTTLKITNQTSDSVMVFLTLNDYGEKYVHNVNEMFGIVSGEKLQGSFTLSANDSIEFTPEKKALSGNISFNNAPVNCPYVGITVYEFTLDNKGIAKNSQETVDISCMAGVSSFGSISMSGGGNWTDNIANDSVTYIENHKLYHNNNISGVFPFGCTNCTNHDGAPDCKGRPAYSKVNKTNLCNVERNANNLGGVVTITYIDK